LNEIKYDYVEFKQHFYLTCCSNRRESTFQKKQTTLEAVAYLGFPAPRDKLSLGIIGAKGELGVKELQKLTWARVCLFLDPSDNFI